MQGKVAKKSVKPSTNVPNCNSNKPCKSMPVSCSCSNPYKHNGLNITPAKFTMGEKIKITYTGLLSESGAEEVFAHIGWGEAWEDVNDLKMSKTKSGFTTNVVVNTMKPLNVCFKDPMNNWDNNDGENYTIVMKNDM